MDCRRGKGKNGRTASGPRRAGETAAPWLHSGAPRLVSPDDRRRGARRILETFIDTAAALIRTLNEQAAALDGRAAFVLGLFTWFLVEQAVRRLAGALRIAIIVAALGGAGLGTAAWFGAFDDGGPPGDWLSGPARDAD